MSMVKWIARWLKMGYNTAWYSKQIYRHKWTCWVWTHNLYPNLLWGEGFQVDLTPPKLEIFPVGTGRVSTGRVLTENGKSNECPTHGPWKMVKTANAFFGSGLKTCIIKRQWRCRVCLWFLILIFLSMSGTKRHKLGSNYSSSAWKASNFQCPEYNTTTLSVDQVASFRSEILKLSGDIGWMTMFACIKEGACPSGPPAPTPFDGLTSSQLGSAETGGTKPSPFWWAHRDLTTALTEGIWWQMEPAALDVHFYALWP